MDKCVQRINIILNAFNSIQLLLQPLEVEFSAEHGSMVAVPSTAGNVCLAMLLTAG